MTLKKDWAAAVSKPLLKQIYTWNDSHMNGMSRSSESWTAALETWNTYFTDYAFVKEQ